MNVTVRWPLICIDAVISSSETEVFGQIFKGVTDLWVYFLISASARFRTVIITSAFNQRLNSSSEKQIKEFNSMTFSFCTENSIFTAPSSRCTAATLTYRRKCSDKLNIHYLIYIYVNLHSANIKITEIKLNIIKFHLL